MIDACLGAMLRDKEVQEFRTSNHRWMTDDGSKIQMAFDLAWQDQTGPREDRLVIRMHSSEGSNATSRQWIRRAGRYERPSARPGGVPDRSGPGAGSPKLVMSISFETGRHPDALRHLLAALQLAERSDILQPFQNHRSVIAALVGTMEQRLESCFPMREEPMFVHRALALLGLNEHRPVPQSQGECPSPAPLSEREHEMMQLVSSMSNAVIARMLGLGENTVKWHLKNVFRKLTCEPHIGRAPLYTGWIARTVG